MQTKYVGNGKEQRSDADGMSYIDKIQSVQGAHLIFRICEEGGDADLQNNLAAACLDSVAILFSIVRCYHEARKWNQEKNNKFGFAKSCIRLSEF